jgi:hypothetical protein
MYCYMLLIFLFLTYNRVIVLLILSLKQQELLILRLDFLFFNSFLFFHFRRNNWRIRFQRVWRFWLENSFWLSFFVVFIFIFFHHWLWSFFSSYCHFFLSSLCLLSLWLSVRFLFCYICCWVL